MTSPQIKILISLSCISIVYAFVCDIIMQHKARKLSKWIQKERPELWSELNFLVKRMRGGQPGLNLLYRQKAVGLPIFDQNYEQLISIQKKTLWGIGIGAVCIGLVIIGTKLWGWQW